MRRTYIHAEVLCLKLLASLIQRSSCRTACASSISLRARLYSVQCGVVLVHLYNPATIEASKPYCAGSTERDTCMHLSEFVWDFPSERLTHCILLTHHCPFCCYRETISPERRTNDYIALTLQHCLIWF